jgi:hypothetical protein
MPEDGPGGDQPTEVRTIGMPLPAVSAGESNDPTELITL